MRCYVTLLHSLLRCSCCCYVTTLFPLRISLRFRLIHSRCTRFYHVPFPLIYRTSGFLHVYIPRLRLIYAISRTRPHTFTHHLTTLRWCVDLFTLLRLWWSGAVPPVTRCTPLRTRFVRVPRRFRLFHAPHTLFTFAFDLRFVLLPVVLRSRCRTSYTCVTHTTGPTPVVVGYCVVLGMPPHLTDFTFTLFTCPHTATPHCCYSMRLLLPCTRGCLYGLVTDFRLVFVTTLPRLPPAVTYALLRFYHDPLYPTCCYGRPVLTTICCCCLLFYIHYLITFMP